MSKDISIQEGGTAKTLNSIKKIRTAKVGGGSVLWVPEDETRLTTKYISKDGTYKASSDGYYGFEQVTVSGCGRATGMKNGNEYSVSTDQSGNLVETKIPSSIQITTPPTKTEYADGEAIDITGMVVKSYYEDGTECGTVNNSEITLDPTTASASQGRDGEIDTSGVDTSKLFNPYRIFPNPIRYNASLINAEVEQIYGYMTHIHKVSILSGSVIPVVMDAYYGGSDRILYFSENTFSIRKVRTKKNGTIENDEVANAQEGTTKDGTVYYYYDFGLKSGNVTTVTDVDTIYTPSNRVRGFSNIYQLYDDMAVLIFNGADSGRTTQEIKAKWPRPEDAKELEATFEITARRQSI